MHTEHARNRCEVNSTGEHLLPFTFFFFFFFWMPNCHTAILKWEFGIGPRDKQKLNFDEGTERCGDGGRHQPWSQLGQGMEGKAATVGYDRAGV